MRLIDADALNEVVDRCMKTTNGKSKEYNTMMFYEIFDFIDNAPTVDAVEVVRCKDCKHEQQCRKAVEHITHERTSVTMTYKPIDFCSCGKREGE